jgi:hypothetical protein
VTKLKQYPLHTDQELARPHPARPFPARPWAYPLQARGLCQVQEPFSTLSLLQAHQFRVANRLHQCCVMFHADRILSTCTGFSPTSAPRFVDREGGSQPGQPIPGAAQLPGIHEMDMSIQCNPAFIRSTVGKISAQQVPGQGSRVPLGIVIRPMYDSCTSVTVP